MSERAVTLTPANPILILSAAWTEFWRKTIVSKTTIRVFIGHFLIQFGCVKFHLFFLDPHLPLRLSEDRKIRDFAERNVAVNFQSLLCLFNHQAKSLFAQAAIVIVKLGYAFIGSRGHLSIDLQPLRDELNS